MAVPLVRQGYYPRDDDYYVILDVDFKATPEEITAAYRKLARQFHPDKHNQDDRSRREAQVIFQKINSAYEVLSDPHKRQIYDALGPEGLKQDGWKLVRKQMTAEEIREEYLRIQKQKLETQHANIAKPRASFTMALDASELFRKREDEGDLDDDDEDRSPAAALIESIPLIEIRSLSASMAVENNLTTNHSMTLSGNLLSKNGTGDGSFGTIYKYKYSPATILNLLFQVGRGPILSASLAHQLNEKTSIFCRGMLMFDTYTIAPSAKITLAHKIRKYLIGKVTYKEGIDSSVTTALVYINERLLVEVTTSYKISRLNQGVSVDFGYRFNNNDSRLNVSLSSSTNKGIAVEYGCVTTVFEMNVVGAALSLSLEAGVTLTVRFSRANQEFSIPIYLSDEVNTGPVFYGTMVPLVAYYLVDRYYIRHYKESR